MPVGLTLAPEVPHVCAKIFHLNLILDRAIMKISRENVLNAVRLT
jgi:hypothetical protein